MELLPFLAQKVGSDLRARGVELADFSAIEHEHYCPAGELPPTAFPPLIFPATTPWRHLHQSPTNAAVTRVLLHCYASLRALNCLLSSRLERFTRDSFPLRMIL